ncbi:MAG: hypothetical protein LBD20_05690, partial [Spirochaetaceae bacterium]|nr:hypothetical protein [Spirochaetaceae bacterium]
IAADADTAQPEDAAERPDLDIAADADTEQPEDAAELPDFDIGADADTEQPEEAAELPDFDIAAETAAEQAIEDIEIPDFDIAAEAGQPDFGGFNAEPSAHEAETAVDTAADESAELPDFSGLINEEIDNEASGDGAANLEDAPPDAENKAAEQKPKEKKKGGGRTTDTAHIPDSFKKELKTVLTYMDKLLEALPDDKIAEFARSEHFETYKKLFKDLDIS